MVASTIIVPKKNFTRYNSSRLSCTTQCTYRDKSQLSRLMWTQLKRERKSEISYLAMRMRPHSRPTSGPGKMEHNGTEGDILQQRMRPDSLPTAKDKDRVTKQQLPNSERSITFDSVVGLPFQPNF